jgi:hypothetical protein
VKGYLTTESAEGTEKLRVEPQITQIFTDGNEQKLMEEAEDWRRSVLRCFGQASKFFD